MERYTAWSRQAQESYGKWRKGASDEKSSTQTRRGRAAKNSRGHSKEDLNWLLTGVQSAPDCGSATQNEPAFQRLKTFCLQPRRPQRKLLESCEGTLPHSDDPTISLDFPHVNI